jgi:hypothetical protein
MSLRTPRRRGRSRRRTHRTSGPRLAGLAAILAALAGAVATVARRRGAASGASGAAGGSGSPSAAEAPGAPPSQEPAAEVVEHTYTCECGQEYRVSGEDRHRVYWLKDAEVSDPVLSQTCPNCDRPLPHDHPTAAA